MKVLRFPNGIQMITLSSALKTINVDTTSVQFTSHPFKFQPDHCLELEKLQFSEVNTKMREFLYDAATKYDLFHYHDLPRGILYTPTANDLKILHQTGKPMIIQHHGSEVRRLSMAKSFENPFIQVKPYWKNEQIIINRLTSWSKIFKHAVVADYELYLNIKDYYKQIHIIRQPIDLSQFTPSYPNRHNKKPIIVHAPSDKGIKGTDYIIDAVQQLQSEGLSFEFKLIENMDHQTALQNYQQADIIIDQLCIGSMGMLSLEGMALGKPVICYIRDDLFNHYPKEIPIVSANPNTIYEKLKNLITDHKSRTEIGIKGRKYIENNHDSLKIAQQFKQLYEDLSHENNN